MSNEKHELLCERNTLLMVTGLKDEIMPEVRKLKSSQLTEMNGVVADLKRLVKALSKKK